MPGPGLLLPSAMAFSGAALFGVGLYVGLNWDTIRDKAQMIIEENKARWARYENELYGIDEEESEDEGTEKMRDEGSRDSDYKNADFKDTGSKDSDTKIKEEVKPMMESTSSDSAYTSSSFVYPTVKYRMPLDTSSSSMPSSMHSHFTESADYDDTASESGGLSDGSEDLGVISMDSEDFAMDSAEHSRQSTPGLV